MREQPKYKTYQSSAFFADGRSARPKVEGTVATDEVVVNEHLQRGTRDGKLVNEMPFEMKLADLQRGRERFDIFCAACHGQLGDGNGMIVQRGFQRPPSFHDPAMRDPNQKPLGHYFDAITRGYGGMYSYADRVPVEDRWRIVAYIRALQLSQNADAGTPGVTTNDPRPNPLPEYRERGPSVGSVDEPPKLDVRGETVPGSSADRASAVPRSPSAVRKAADAVVTNNAPIGGGLTDPTNKEGR